MAQTHRYKQNIRRLSKTVPGYDPLCLEIPGDITIARLDFPSNGYGHLGGPPDRRCLEDPDLLVEWLDEELENIETRYILVEDINSLVYHTLGSVFCIEPNFFLNHMNNQLARFPATTRDKQAQWNTWNLPAPYNSFRWYRPASRSKHSDSVLMRRQIEERYERVRKGRPEFIRDHETQTTFRIDIVRSVSNILRPEWDLSYSTMAADSLVAIEERVSIFQTTRNGAQYVIMLLDAVPRASMATWTEIDRASNDPCIPPANAEFTIKDLYENLVPRFTLNMSSAMIPSLRKDRLKEIYETLSSTLKCLQDNCHPANQVTTTDLVACGHLPFIHLFRIVVSDTLGLLQLLDTVQRDIVQSIASQDAQIDDILIKRTFIAKLLAQLPPLCRELIKSLNDLLEQGNGNPSQHKTIDDLASNFENTIQDLKEASNAITGTLQFIESHRAILEAESITRLTELAFLFIPLSFAASLFSMQIQPLTSPVPVEHFIAFALSLSISTYALRLLTRSAWVHAQKQKTLTAIRTHSSVPRGAPIPNTAILAWIFARLAPILVLLLIVACILVPPLAVLWMRELDSGLRIAVTFLFLVFVVSICGGVLLAVPDLRRLFQNWLGADWYRDAAADEGTTPGGNIEPLRRRLRRWIVGVVY